MEQDNQPSVTINYEGLFKTNHYSGATLMVHINFPDGRSMSITTDIPTEIYNDFNDGKELFLYADRLGIGKNYGHN